MEFLKDKCLSCNICCRFPERYSPFIPFFMGKERGAYYGCRIDVIRHGDGYICPYFQPEKNRCSIYDNRPLDCRLYPFMITYDNRYKKVILVLDNHCPYSKELIKFKNPIDSKEITEQNIGFINGPQPGTIFLNELPGLTEYIFGKTGKFRKLRLEDGQIISYLWRDIMNVLYDEGTHKVYYGTQGNFKRFPIESKDYVYLRKDLIELKGVRYKDKRNLCNNFGKNYSYKIEMLSPSDEHLNLYKEWAENKIKKGINQYQQQLIEDSFFFHRRAFLDFNALGLEGIEIRIGNKLAGYTFGFRLNNETFCILGEITDIKYKGINQFIFREFCRVIPNNYKYINTMDDSEIEGLRKNKLSYHPITKI